MAERRFHRGGATARRRHYQSARIVIGRFRRERCRRHRAIPDQRHTEKRLAQRGGLFRWKLRRRKRSDRIVSDPRRRRQMGNRPKSSDQRLQPREDRQIGRGIEGRENGRERSAQIGYFNFSPVNLSNASTYFAAVRAMTSPGNVGPGGVLFQSSVSR